MAVKEVCVRCGQSTPYEINYPVYLRKWYVDGSGQLCEECWNYLFVSEVKMCTNTHKKVDGEHKDVVE